MAGKTAPGASGGPRWDSLGDAGGHGVDAAPGASQLHFRPPPGNCRHIRNGATVSPDYPCFGVAALRQKIGSGEKMENYAVKRSGQQHATSMKDEVWLTAYVVADDK